MISQKKTHSFFWRWFKRGSYLMFVIEVVFFFVFFIVACFHLLFNPRKTPIVIRNVYQISVYNNFNVRK